MDKRPVYLLAGGRGGGNMDAVIRRVFKDIGQPSPGIAYVGVANGESREFFGWMETMLKKVHDCSLVHAKIGGRVDLNRAKDALMTADAIFVGGGDVEAGMQILEQKGMTAIFRDLFEQGKLCFGVSAGSIMLAREWVRWSNPDDDSTAELFPCLNVAPVLCDTHSEGDNWEELQAALALGKNSGAGYGIRSNACLVVQPDGKVEALGGIVDVYSRQGNSIRKLEDLKPRSR
jgi:peptidase E